MVAKVGVARVVGDDSCLLQVFSFSSSPFVPKPLSFELAVSDVGEFVSFRGSSLAVVPAPFDFGAEIVPDADNEEVDDREVFDLLKALALFMHAFVLADLLTSDITISLNSSTSAS